VPEELQSLPVSPLFKTIFRTTVKFHVWIYRRTNGRLGGSYRIGAGFLKPVPIVLLEHRGRRSGREFVVPVLYLRDGLNIVVVASQGGLPTNPQWYGNLVAAPDTHIQIGADRTPVHAVTANPEDRARLWPLLVAAYADFATYQSRTARQLPVLVLQPR
jgi:deazaflavin-dependent oxidoreductase (nitroreductase family)